MSKLFMETEKQILLASNFEDLGYLINVKGYYLRQLAYGVINGSYTIETASRLLINY